MSTVEFRAWPRHRPSCDLSSTVSQGRLNDLLLLDPGEFESSLPAQPTWPIAVIAKIRWLGEIGRISYCLCLIHDAVRIGGVFLLKSLRPNTPSWEFVATNAVAAIISYLIARLSWTYFEYPLLRRGHEFKY